MSYLNLKKIIYRASSKINKQRYPFLASPGMMGYDERMNLFSTCRNELTGKGVAVEFGSFLGASTAAIQQGLRKNKKILNNSEFHIVDCFRSSLTSEFSELTRDFARSGKVDHLLTEEDGWLCFYQAFLAHIDTNDPYIKIHQCFLSAFTWESKPVEFLHLDLPKDWKQASYIVSIIFPDLVIGAKVLFQDFGYQWSAELIAMIGILSNMGIISPYRLTDTTLSVTVEKTVTVDHIDLLARMMTSPIDVISGIESAKNACRKLSSPSIDATLSMAKAHYKYSINDVDGCFDIVSSILLNSPCDLVIRVRLADLFQRAFICDRSYEKPHEVSTSQGDV